MNITQVMDEEFRKRYLFACKQGGLDNLVSFYNKPQLSKFQKFLSFLKIGESTKAEELIRLEHEGFVTACQYGNDHIVDFFIQSKKINYSDKKIITNGCFEALGNGHLSVTKSLAPHIEHQDSFYINSYHAFNRLCSYGNLEAIKYMLTDQTLSIDDQIINLQYNEFNEPCEGFVSACENGRIEVVKYLTSSPELKTHVDLNSITEPFEVNHEIVRHFIFDLGLTRKDTVMQNLIFTDEKFLSGLLEKIELQKELSSTLCAAPPENKRKYKI